MVGEQKFNNDHNSINAVPLMSGTEEVLLGYGKRSDEVMMVCLLGAGGLKGIFRSYFQGGYWWYGWWYGC